MSKNILVSDVGGTNGRFAIADVSDTRTTPKIHSAHVLSCKNYASFYDMLDDYLSKIDSKRPEIAHLAIAGEMTPEHGNLWHFNWDISAKEIKDRFGFISVKLLNDYEALVKAVPYLKEGDLLTLTPNKNGLQDAPFCVFGAGSGLGGAIGVPMKLGLTVISTEIGHISFAPKNKVERDLLNYYAEKIDHISNEIFLSGAGLIRLHEFISQREEQPLSKRTGPEITKAAAEKSDVICQESVKLFLAILGSVAGDIALAHGARHGVYIAGGVVPKIADMIDTGDFMQRFCNKGPMSPYVEKIPVHIITADMPALIGAAIHNN